MTQRLTQWFLQSPLYLLVSGYFLLLLAGRYSWGRVENDPTIHPLLEIRFPIFAVVVVLWFLVSSGKLLTCPQAANARRWVFWVALFHIYLALGCWWVGTIDEVVLYRAAELLLMIVLLFMCDTVFGLNPNVAIPFFFLLCFAASVAYALGGISGYWHLDQRATAFGGGPNIFVRVVGTGIFASLYFWGRSGRAFWLLPCPLLVLSAVLSGSRGGMLGLLVSLPLCCYGIWRIAKRQVWFGIAAVAVLAMLVIAFTPLGEHVQQFWQARYVNLTFSRHYVSSRDNLFLYAREMFFLYPLAGVGLDGYEQLTGYIYPHNLILNIACEGGLVGLVFFILSICWLGPRWFRTQGLEQTVACSLGIFYFVASMFSGTYYDARYMWVFFYIYMLQPRAVQAAGEFVPSSFTAHRGLTQNDPFDQQIRA